MKNDGDLHINRGVDLMLSGGHSEKKTEKKTWEVHFGKLISLFHREIHFFIQISFDIKKK
jgi:hypothetical protein|tara:strand:+ start:204 stop:383 length:180 start_codon:yes stop_codon:yes gene_type:complete